MPLHYPEETHVRRHGPRGYRDYRSFKPWLRDEFGFRCVYCLWRENWCVDGEGSFSVEHLHSRVVHPERVCDYDNLLYACCRCNSLKQEDDVPIDPCREGWAQHLEVRSDGLVWALTRTGADLIEVCRLNRPLLVNGRRMIMEIMELLAGSTNDVARWLRQHYFGFPENLPDLSSLQPPGGNQRPEGIANSYFERRRRGQLPTFY